MKSVVKLSEITENDISSLKRLIMNYTQHKAEFNVKFWGKDDAGDYHEIANMWEVDGSDSLFFVVNRCDFSPTNILSDVTISWNEYSITFNFYDMDNERILYVRIPDCCEIDVDF